VALGATRLALSGCSAVTDLITSNPPESHSGWGSDRAAGDVKLVCAKNTNWLLFNPNQLQKLAQ
jgi:hypothetical protein